MGVLVATERGDVRKRMVEMVTRFGGRGEAAKILNN
jgi:hypothetical protein